VIDVVSKVNTGAKFDSKVFQKSVGLNGVGTKAVNALSHYFKVTAIREGKEKTAEFERGFLIKEYRETKTSEQNGTLVTLFPTIRFSKFQISCGIFRESDLELLFSECRVETGL
jgi:topoisomerase-4 subunit B